jgi:hypothetical protein
MLTYAGEFFVLEVCGAKSVDERIVWVICSSFCDIPFLVFRVDEFDFILHKAIVAFAKLRFQRC